MVTFGSFKELIVTLKYHYRKKHKSSRNHVKIFFLFKVPKVGLNTSLKVTFRSSHPEKFHQKDVLKNFAKVRGKYLSGVIFNKVSG